MGPTWETYLNEHQSRFVDELCELLRIPSVSTDPGRAGDVRRAAEWTVHRLRAAGLENAQMMETDGHPVVYADWAHAPGQPTVLIYGHYDVQPADPLALWETPPFEPSVRDNMVFARGANDMKGNLLLPVIACEALLQTEGRLPVNVKFLFEGEEEIGSPSLEHFIETHSSLLTCDLTVSADGGVGDAEHPSVGVGVRGLIAMEVTVRTANTDLHSGNGGIAPNAIHALVHMLDQLRDPDGRILVDGYYDEVRSMSAEDRREIAESPLDVPQFLARNGIKAAYGEPEFSPKERMMARPTLEINGIWGGYQEEGTKTVIPCEAHAKLTCRLVPDQNPERVHEMVAAYLRKVVPSYADVEVRPYEGDANPYLVPQDHPALAALVRAVGAFSDSEPRRIRTGGTVPVMGMLKRMLGVDTFTLGASSGDGRSHAPNEFLRLANFVRSQRAFCLYFHELAR